MVSEEIRAMIPDYVRGLLSPSDVKEVEAAMDGSPEILREFEAAQVYYASLNQIPEVKAPPDFVGRVNRRIDRQSLRPRLLSLFFEPLQVKLPIELAGVTVCLVIALAIHYPFQHRERLPLRSAPVVMHRQAAPAIAVREEPDKRQAEEKHAELKLETPSAAAARAVLPSPRPSHPPTPTSAPSIDAIPPLSVSVVSAVSARPKESGSQGSPDTVNDIGAIELTYIMPENSEIDQPQVNEGAITAAAASALETILRAYDRHYFKNFQNSKVTYTCTFPPGRLSALIEDLGHSFSVTTHLFPDQAQQSRPITLSVILQ